MRVDEGRRGAAFIALMVARGWGWDRVPPRWEPREQDAGDHQGNKSRSHPLPTTLAPTARPASCLTSRLRVMPLGRHELRPYRPPNNLFIFIIAPLHLSPHYWEVPTLDNAIN